jgi:signal peptidase I
LHPPYQIPEVLMQNARSIVDEPADRPAGPGRGMVRQTVELLVCLSLCVILVRTFSAEAYVVPTGSMAPTLMGWHRELVCPNCEYAFDVGIDEEGRTGSAVCPNCGDADLDRLPAVECGGDRVLVQKFLYDFRPPKRWEVAVFHYPGDPSQAYVKRVVGLPGESIRLIDGDVYADGRILRKTLDDQRAMRILVHDSRFQPKDTGGFPRWVFRSGWGYRSHATGWSRTDRGFVHQARPDAGPGDWVIYRHFDPARRRYGAVRDFYAYNGGELPADNEVVDLGLEARMTVDRTVDAISAALRSGSDQFEVRIPVGLKGEIELVHNGHRVPIQERANPFHDEGAWPRAVTLEASAFDRRVMVAVDGKLLFEPYDYERPRPGPSVGEIPIGVGVDGGDLTIDELRIFRDIHYTGSLASTPRQGHGLRSPVPLGADEYYVLGDNSPVSNDSRFWSNGPVVPGSMLLGKPFLVHLPGEVVPLRVFGRSVCWVPDPRRIRYIR